MSITYRHNEFGTVTHHGVTVELTDQAELTSRLLPSNYTNYNDVSEGDEYDEEWSAPGRVSTGEDVMVYWIFKNIRGENAIAPEDLEWGNVDRIEIR